MARMVNLIARNGQPFCPIRHTKFSGKAQHVPRRDVKCRKINSIISASMLLFATT